MPYTERWNDGERDWSFVKDPRIEIERWENETSHKLPSDYRDFMYRFNGGRVYPRNFRTALIVGLPTGPYVNNSDLTYMDLILSWKSVEEHWRGKTYGKGVPPKHLVIAKTPGGIQLLMALTEKDNGKIYSWLHSTSEWGSEGNEQLHLQSNDFSSFLKSLFENDPSEFKNWYGPTFQRLARDFEI